MAETRVVQDSDISQLFRLITEFQASIGEQPPDQNSFDKIRKAILDKKIHFVVAEENSSLVGMCSLSPAFSTYRSSNTGIFDDFFILTNMRKRGIAHEMIRKALVLAKEIGCGSVILGCSLEDIPMYSHFGFKKIGDMMAIDC